MNRVVSGSHASFGVVGCRKAQGFIQLLRFSDSAFFYGIGAQKQRCNALVPRLCTNRRLRCAVAFAGRLQQHSHFRL